MRPSLQPTAKRLPLRLNEQQMAKLEQSKTPSNSSGRLSVLVDSIRVKLSVILSVALFLTISYLIVFTKMPKIIYKFLKTEFYTNNCKFAVATILSPQPKHIMKELEDHAECFSYFFSGVPSSLKTSEKQTKFYLTLSVL